MLENCKQWEGQVVAAFRLRTLLGGSPESAVFLTEYARGTQSDQAAIKLIPADPQDSDAQLARWKRAAELSHPRLLSLLQMGRCELDGVALLYVVMELADEDLSQIIPQRALTADEAREMLAPTLEALAYLHEKGFAHAAIKPANIMAAGDQLKLSSDRLVPIGEAKRGASAPSAYDPPEAARGVISPAGEMSPAGDSWSLGMTLVEILMQALPAWEWGSPDDPELPANLPQPFLDIAQHCVCHEVQRRWSVAQIAARLQQPAAPVAVATAATPSVEGAKPRAAVQSNEKRATEQRARKSKTNKPKSKTGYAVAAITAALVAAIFFGPRLLRRGGDDAPVSDAAPSAAAAPQEVSPTPAADAEPAPGAASERTAAEASAGNAMIAPAVASVPPPSSPETSSTPIGAAATPAPSSTRVSTPASGAVLERVLPEISPSAAATIQGTVRVTVRVGVDPSGAVTAAAFDFASPSSYFSSRAMEAAKRWKFAPANAAAGNVPSEWLLRFEFTKTGTNVTPLPATR